MKKYSLHLSHFGTVLGLLALFISPGCQKSIDKQGTTADEQASSVAGQGKAINQGNSNVNKKVGHFTQVNLVANTAGYGAAKIDPTLINGWGIAFSANGIAWVNSQGGHVSELYDREGNSVGVSRVHIPLPFANEGGNPTGIVFSGSTTDFPISGGPARFIFVGVDGVLSAWNGTLGNHAVKVAFVPQAAFTGLTLATMGNSTFLYAANFAAGRIDVWNSTWQPVSLPFNDPNIPAGYSPYNIENIDGLLYVAYAKVGPDGRTLAGVGLGYVDVYHPNGTLVKRFASGGPLNAPWGIAKAPDSFFKGAAEDEDDSNNGHGHDAIILIGNFGDGRINAYRADGKFKGQLRGESEPITIDGLWAIKFPPSTSTIDPNRLYFAAGPNHENDGLFGYIIPRLDGDDD
jgi:uncharacterized protein (TIGR03118 family)